MAKVAYTYKEFRPAHLDVIQKANAIAATYRAEGYSLTLRQLYYQFVARGYLPNRDQEYKRLGSILNDARLAGLFDWSHMVDLTRSVAGGDGSMTEPIEVIEPSVYYRALWEGQTHRFEVWVEKDALTNVVQRACGPLRVPYFSCRGYTSQTALRDGAMRVLDLQRRGLDVTILHLGDHDPSGIDMTRDIEDRLALFVRHHGGSAPEVRRLALNMDQVRQYDPPPNPAKITDSRARDYILEYGDESWELDALEPSVIVNLVREAVRQDLDPEPWAEQVRLEKYGEATLEAIRDNYQDVVDMLEERGLMPELDVPDLLASDDEGDDA